MKKYLLTLFLCLAAVCTQAAVGLRELPGREGDGPVTVFYPTAAPDQALSRGPYRLEAAVQVAPVRGNGRLVVISHGSGGIAWGHADLARQLVNAGFVVALPEHQGDNWHDMAKAGPASWKQRPDEVSRAIDAVAADAQLAPLLSLGRVGMYGMSAGGHTALTLAGGRWSPSELLRHCELHLDDDFQTCVGLATHLDGGALDGAKKAIASFMIRRRLDDPAWYGHTDPRIAAIVAEVPFAADFDPASLAAPRMPLGLVRAGQDRWLLPQFHIDTVRKACAGCVLVDDLPSAGHGSLLSPQPPLAQLPSLVASLLSDPPGFSRADVPRAHANIVAFMRRHLLP